MVLVPWGRLSIMLSSIINLKPELEDLEFVNLIIFC
jgi:hypothetical protein